MSRNLDVMIQSVSRETLERLNYFSDLVLKWTKAINLIAPKTATNIWDRHIKDSAQIYYVAPYNWRNWTDIGSGGGMPGLVVSILDEQQRPVTLIESDKRKCMFLNTVKRELNLNITVINGRIEDQKITSADILSARALAPLDQLFKYSTTLLNQDGRAIFLKGAQFQEDLDQASKNWQFNLKTHPSQTNKDSRVLQFSRIKPRER